MELINVYIQLGVLFMLMLIGYILGKIKFFTPQSNAIFSKFIVNVALPAVIISGMNMPLTKERVNRASCHFGIINSDLCTYIFCSLVDFPYTNC